MLKLVLVFVGGGIGSVLRYSVGLLVARLTPAEAGSPHWLGMYPVATLSVNLVGCALIGLTLGLLGRPEAVNQALRVALVVGVLGGFTTFSSFGWETLELISAGRTGTAAAYVAGSVIVGVLAAWGGHHVGLTLAGP